MKAVGCAAMLSVIGLAVAVGVVTYLALTGGA